MGSTSVPILDEFHVTEDSQAKSVAERVKHYRSKKTEEIYIAQKTKKDYKNVQKLNCNAISDKSLSPFKAAALERKRKGRQLKKISQFEGITGDSMKKNYKTHYTKKTVKNTYRRLPRSPAARAEVLAKLAEEALKNLELLKASKVETNQKVLDQNSEIEYQEKL